MHTEQMNSVSPPLFAAAAGLLFGLADGARAVVGDLVPDTVGSVATCLALDGGLCALGATLIGLTLRRRPALAIWSSLAGLGLLRAALWWFEPPPPFVEVSTLHGSRPIALGVLVLILALTGLLARLSAQRRVSFALAPLGLLAWATSGGHPALSANLDAPASPRSVLLVSIDTTRADHIGAWGSEVRTPNIDRLASEGVRFRDAMSQIPVTGPSHLTLMSGAGPWTHGNLLNGAPVPADQPLLADTLHHAGWRTGAFVSSFVLDGRFGLDRGFQVYDDELGGRSGWSGTLPGRIEERLAWRLWPDRELERGAGETVDRALDWLNDQGDAPFFAWVHLFDPHGPYAPPEPWDEAYYHGNPRDPANTSMSLVHNVAEYLRPSLAGITDVNWVRAQYSGEISYADSQLGRLLDWLDSSGRAGSTLVVVVGDHGESLGEHDVWFNHGDDLFEAEVHVPMVFRLPGAMTANVAQAGPVELCDVAPTVLDLLGTDAKPAADGISLLPWLIGAPESAPRTFARSLAWDRPANLAARAAGLADGPRWRVVALRALDGRYVLREQDGQGQWYDLASDPAEANPLPPPEDRAASLATAAADVLAGHKAEPSAPATGEADEVSEKLRALGYIEE